MIEILEPGLECSVQDRGRDPQFIAMTWAPTGAFDNLAYRFSNLLVGNEPGDFPLVSTGRGELASGTAGLEITLHGTRLRFTEPHVIALTGADLQPKLNGVAAPLWQEIEVKAGDVLECGAARRGMRMYLGVQGGITAPVIAGARSTLVLCYLGGPFGRSLRAGDLLSVDKPQTGGAKQRKLPKSRWPEYANAWTLRVIMGPQDHRFTEESVQTFLGEEAVVSSALGRSAIRLKSPQLEFKPLAADAMMGGTDPSNVVDDIFPMGSIQCPSGSPILIGCEGPTGGGYAKIAVVISADLWKMGQLRPHDRIRFVSVTLEEAGAAASELQDWASNSSIVYGA